MKLAFATDLHIGATATDFHQQTYAADCHAAAVAALGELLAREQIQLLLLGGDMTHGGTPAGIERFVQLFKGLPADIMLCLGNHDVSLSPEVDALAMWRKALDPHRSFSLAPAALVTDEVDVLALNTQWANGAGEAKLYWKPGMGPQARLSGADALWLDEWLGRERQKPAIVMVHGELDGLPPALTGLASPIHVPAEAYLERINAVLDRHPRVKLVLAGHNHVTHAVRHGGRVHLTTGSMSEVPFFVRIIEVSGGVIRVRTESLMETRLPIAEAKRWALGRPEDREMVIG